MHIAFVGGGPSCTATYIELACRFHTCLSKISIFDPKGIFNSTAFKTETDVPLAKSSVAVTSILGRNRMDFLAWLNDHHPDLRVHPESFVPRHLVRKYARSRFSTARRFLESFNCQTEILREEVTDLHGLDTDTFWLTTTDGSWGPFSAVILGTGVNYKQPFAELDGHPNFIKHPFPESALLKKASGAEHILVLGTRLSAIDAALTVLTSLPKTRVTLASPSGGLPAVRGGLLLNEAGHFRANALVESRPPSLLRAAEKAAIADLRRVSCQEKPVRHPVSGAHGRLTADIENCEAGTNRWQHVIASFLDEINKLWPHLSVDEQKRFWAKHQHFIDRYITSVPLDSARQIAAHMEGGRLSVRPLANKDAPVTLRIDGRFEGCDGVSGFVFDRVLNATGLATGAFRQTPLYRNLLARQNLLNPHGGLAVDTRSMRLAGASPDARVYAIGPPVTGCLLLTNDLRSSVEQARRIGDDIAASLARVSTPLVQVA